MHAGRKRKRVSSLASSADHYGNADPPPFAPAQLSLLKSYRSPLSRSLTCGLSPLVLNLMLIAGHRLQAQDFQSAAAVLPTLLKRYRKVKTNRWFFTREIGSTGAEILRRASPQHASLLDEYLAHISRDAHISTRTTCEGYASRACEAALLDRVMGLLVDGNISLAFESLFEQSQEDLFRQSPLVHGYLGVVALAASSKEKDPSHMLHVAATALSTAAELQPAAYFYAYYAAGAAIAAGRRADALDILRGFVAKKNRSDPIALYGLLSCLEELNVRDSNEIRQERVDIARRLLVVNPMSKQGMNTIREAHAWEWHVKPGVDGLEVAEVFGVRIEHGDCADVALWTELGMALSREKSEQSIFWTLSGRSKWWPGHFFKLSRLKYDLATNAALASVKGGLAKLLSEEPCPYAEGVAASGVVDLYPFGEH